MTSGKIEQSRTRAAARHTQTLSSIMTLSKEFADSTSMHGIKYIAQENTSLLERYGEFFFFSLGTQLLYALLKYGTQFILLC